jgi:hypothetical protein
MANADFKIFKANRLKFAELQEDAYDYIKRIYATNNESFSPASPFIQIVNVVLHLGRMILFYIENSITELNINTAFKDRSIRGLATLTGHVPSLGIAARGSLWMTYNMSQQHVGETVTIKNYTKIKNTSNGLIYLVVFPNNDMKLTIGSHDTKIELPIIQGALKYQQATGTGESLQSFNFAHKTGEIIDNFFMNIYVNGERWENVDSFLDLSYGEKACVIKPSINGGIDVFFGTGINGGVPQKGSSILFEYLTCAGSNGNVFDTTTDNYWEFEDSGYGIDGDYIDLNNIYTLSSATEILFGTDEESLEMTRRLAPHASRSFVLANSVNYKYFLTKLNIFSTIDVFSGFNTNEDAVIEEKYNNAKNVFNSAKESYLAQVNLTGKSSDLAEEKYNEMLEAQQTFNMLKSKYEDSKLDDNVIYLYLVPDITKRISSSENYFTCSTDRFKLSDDEKNGILNLLDNSGQKIITSETRIIDPIFVKFAINIFIQMWDTYNFSSVKSSIINVLSDYFISNTRRDRIPISDLVKIVENVSGVDSVSIVFDADVKNEVYYGTGNYGIDEYGDIILSRTIKDKLGNSIEVNDLFPLFRGGFTSANGIEYGDDLNSLTSMVNITLRGKSRTN